MQKTERRALASGQGVTRRRENRAQCDASVLRAAVVNVEALSAAKAMYDAILAMKVAAVNAARPNYVHGQAIKTADFVEKVLHSEIDETHKQALRAAEDAPPNESDDARNLANTVAAASHCEVIKAAEAICGIFRR